MVMIIAKLSIRSATKEKGLTGKWTLLKSSFSMVFVHFNIYKNTPQYDTTFLHSNTGVR